MRAADGRRAAEKNGLLMEEDCEAHSLWNPMVQHVEVCN